MCKFFSCCRFFAENLSGMPKTVVYIKNRFCLGDYAKCASYMYYQAFSAGAISLDLCPEDTDDIENIIQCLHSKGKADSRLAISP